MRQPAPTRKIAALVLTTLFFSLLPMSPFASAATPLTTAEKAVVKIYNYDLDEDNWLEAKGSGSGVIISSDGLVLTNAHVVEGDDTLKNSDPYFAICLTEQINAEPVCRYSARLIAADEDKDIAILKMRSLAGAVVSGLDYLELATATTPANGTNLTLYGFPDIGGDTLTSTTGTVVGQEQGYAVNWLKTDAIISFGSSGGAAVNSDHKVVGLVSQAMSSSLNTLSYVIDINSVSAWINQNKFNNGTPSILESRLNSVLSRTLSAKTSQTISLSYPKISLTCPTGFAGKVEESSITCEAASGSFGVQLSKSGYEKTFDDLKNLNIESLLNGLGIFSALINITSEESTFAGRQAMKYTISALGTEATFYSFPFRQFTISVAYDYGTGDINKDAIDAGLQSFTLDTSYTEPFTEQTSYSQTDPLVILSPTANWVFLEKNSFTEPVEISLKHQPNIMASFETEMALSSEEGLSNQDYYEQNNALSDLGDSFSEALTGLKTEIIDVNYNYELNSTIKDAIKVDKKMINATTNLTKFYYRNIDIRREGYVINFSFIYNGSDEAGFNTLKTASDQLLSHLTVSTEGAPPAVSKESVNPEPYAIDEPIEDEPVIIENPERYTADELEFLQKYGLSRLPWEKAVPEETAPPTELLTPANQLSPLPSTSHNEALASRLSGRLLLSVEDRGKIYYVNPSDHYRYQVTFGNALTLFRHFAMGISNADLNKIPINANSVQDNVDTDSDGFSDKSEVTHGYNPEIPSNPSARGNDKMKFDTALANRLKGRFLLQVADRGRIWYVDQSGTRWEITWNNLMDIFHSLALGINNEDLAQIGDNTNQL